MRHMFFAPALGAFGNGILSRTPIRSVENIPIPDPEPHAYNGYYEPRCILKAELKGGLTLLITHFGLNPDEKESAVKTVLMHLKDEKCVLMGDFNVTPDDPVLAPIRERMNDAAALFGGEKLSFPSDKPTQKIDYIFASPDIEIVSADIPAIVASDHRPHVAEIKL
jgi:endonuclease/exonuclease/phosphatase family metal-dependent hydrolase